MFAQVVDDTPGRPSRRPPPWRPTCAPFDGDKTAKARKVGELVAERAKAAGVDTVVFDRAGNPTTAASPPSPTAPARAACVLTNDDFAEGRGSVMMHPSVRGGGAGGRDRRRDRRDRATSATRRRPPTSSASSRSTASPRSSRAAAASASPPRRRRRRRRHGRRRLRQGQGGARGDRQGRRGGQEELLQGPPDPGHHPAPRQGEKAAGVVCCVRRLPVPASSPVARCAPCSSAPASTTC
jgi:hypothetical protein